MPQNTAIWLPGKLGALAVGAAPYTPPGADQIVVRTHAVAVNPVDRMIQSIGDVIYPWLRYPAILGEDVSGEVVEVGSAVTRFAIGDRVLGHGVGSEKGRAAAEGAFQEYVVVLERLAAPIPDDMPYERAAVLPLGLSTAASALFQTDTLGLRHPSADSAPEPTDRREWVLIWGGSTSVGSNAIQLATAAGYRVVTTCSPHNVDYVTGLGAAAVFDYRSPRVVDDIVAAVGGAELAGALAVGTGSAGPSLAVVRRSAGRKLLMQASTPASFERVGTGRGRRLRLLRTLPRFVGANVALQIRARASRIRTTFVWGSSLMENEVCRVVYEDFLPRALAEGRFVAAPDPLVVGHGLDAVRTAFETLGAGVSARKVVVTL